MKLNHPVTGKEIAWGTNASIISKTDLKGAITYANETFCEVSGYSQAELLGKNHNIVRHPDVPPAAFQDLWDKLNAGRPWTGIVKNRAKNGDHYWVEAHVSPVYRDGRVVEYLSVRRAVSAAQIKEAEEVYRVLNQGGLPKPSWAQRLNFVSRMSMGRKLAAMGVTVLVALLVLMGALMSDRLQQLNEAERKIAGVEYIQPLRDLLQNLPQHRGFANGYLNGDSVFAERLRNKQTDIAQNLSAISAMDALHGISLEASELFERIVSDWSAIREGYERMDATTAFDRHTALIAEVIELIRQVGDVSGLTAAELLDQRYMVDLLVSEIPRVSETLGRARGLGAGIAAKGVFADGQKETLAALVLSVRASLTSIDRAMESIYRVAPAMKDSLGELVEQGRPHRDAFLGIVSSGLLNADQISQDSAELFGKGTALIDSLFTLFDRTAGELVTELSHAENMARFHIYELLFWGGMLTLFLGFVGYMLVRDMGRGFNQVINIFRRIADGHYYDSIDLHRFDELGEVMRNLKTMQVKLGADLAESREHGQAAMRVKTALDHASNPVMMAGNDGHIIYLNKSAQRLFTEAESDLRKDLPHFKAAELFGANIDIFHKNPQHQRSMLAALKGTFTSEFEVGGRALRVVANPVMDTEGQRLGTAVEWTDRTAEIQIEREVENIVNAARSGDLAKRISATGKMGFNARLSQGINDLLNTTASVFDEIALVMGHLSRGNLAHPMTGEYTGMYELIKDDVNESIRILKDTIQQLGESAESIDTASSEILAGNTNLSSRTEQQAGSLQETASSMEQLTSTVKANADNAIRANTLAANGKMAARKGGDVVHRAIGAMGEIRAASGRIGEIIGVIDEIAFQTNLLALNASVEAARAGEQGRGFAVVASEVRNLAGRSATAAKEIKELIQDTVAKVEVGSALVGESGARLQEIVDAVQNVGDIVSEIATASNEQYAGIEQVNRAVSSMDEVTQQNAALAEQTSAASGSMQEKTRDMRRLMEFFRAESVSESVDADRTQLLKARAAHLSWRSRIRDYLDGELSMSEKDAVSHRDCTLGKWLYAGGYERFSGYEAMKILEPEHAKLHATIKDIVQLKQAGRAEEAERQYARIEDASSTVVRLLKEIEGRIN